jgi:NAD(P)-dependent dehydrogenase (short-subunit alcohol dehydrogenase family)
MTASLAGKVAIVTGGASGLGCAIVQRFVDAGAEAVIADVNDHEGEQLASEFGARAWFQHADVALAEDVHALVQAAVDRFGGLDVMVNNAGISSKMHKGFLHDDLADFSKVMSVNLLGVMLGTQEAARYMAANDGGSIINMASIGGLQAGGGVMTYRASKAAVIHFTKSVRSGDCRCHGCRFGRGLRCFGHASVMPTPAERWVRSALNALWMVPASRARRWPSLNDFTADRIARYGPRSRGPAQNYAQPCTPLVAARLRTSPTQTRRRLTAGSAVLWAAHQPRTLTVAIMPRSSWSRMWQW